MRWVVNASPIILLAAVDHLDLLQALCDELVIPAAVAAEIRLGDESDAARLWIEGAGAAWVRSAEPIDPAVAGWGLGPGESAVLSFARLHPEFEAVVDDRAARNCARSLSIRTRGTLGILILAKTAGHLPHVRPVFEQLVAAGMRIDQAVLERALRLAGEL